MKKQTLHSISNWDKKSCYKFRKSDNYYDFLFGLLELEKMPVPDIYDAKGVAETIFEDVNSSTRYLSKDGAVEIIQITSEDFVFLIINPTNNDVKKYISENSEFVKG